MANENTVSAEANGSEPFAEARGSGAPDRACPLCEGKGWRHILWMRNGGMLEQVECIDCLGTGRRPALPNDAGELQPPPSNQK